MEVIKQLRRWRDYKLDQRVIGKKRLIYCFSDSMEIILNSMKKSVTISTNENVLVDIGTEQLKNSGKLLGIKINSKLNLKTN